MPTPRLDAPKRGPLEVPAYTDLKLHDITTGFDDPNQEALDMNQPAGSDGFFAGNGKFLTRKLWDVGNTAPYGHRGDVTTITEAILLHGGEGRASRDAFVASSVDDQKSIVAFLKSLQVVPQGAE